LQSILRFLKFLPGGERKTFLDLRDPEGVVNCYLQKRPRLRLDSELYEQLRNQVLSRDGWRCQACGAMSNLEVHHKEFRSQAGHDSEENLITLCITCHGSVHHG
jgi:5-methylcytosine-specific restriction endonuclease McrA